MKRLQKILLVDDDPAVRRLFRMLLSSVGFVKEAANGEDGLELVADWQPDLVLLDINMPGIDGYETCRRLKSLPMELPPQVVMVSGASAVSEQAKAFEMGADDYLVKPVDPVQLKSRVELHRRLRESRVATAKLQREVDMHHVALRRAAAERAEALLATQDVAVLTLAKVAESRDNDTGDHLIRLREYAQRLAEELAKEGPYAEYIDAKFLDHLYRASPLHDIGKVGIPDAILLKPDRLTPDEWEVMRRHTTIGGNILNDAVMQSTEGGFLMMAALVTQFHHERWDGKGYPAGLLGEEIPLPARIVSVADVYDALTSKRPYKEAWSPEAARQAIVDGSGTQFDPVIVEAFERCFDDILQIQSENADRDLTAVGAMTFAKPGPVEAAR